MIKEIKEIKTNEPVIVDGVLTSIDIIKENTIKEFINKCKATHDGLICNWDKPYGITFKRMEDKAKDYMH